MADTHPGWLDEAFVKQVLGSVEGVSEEQISVSKWQCNPAVPPGSNYLSLLYRLRVDYKSDNNSRSISLIVKSPLETGQVKEWMEQMDGYGKELRIYCEVLPRMYELNGSVKVTARSFACSLHNFLVLEDLKELKYKMADSLARFHGMSVALYEKDPDFIESVGKNPWFNEEDLGSEELKQQEQFTKFNLTAMLLTVKSLGLDRYAEVIRGKIDFFHSKMQQIFKPHGELRVLNHGDCWTNNVLFKYDDANQVIDAKLVDFHMIKTGSYAQDLLYFWWTSANLEVRENSQEEMFEVYLKTLNQTLEDLQVPKRLSKDEFDNEMQRFSAYSLFVCCSLLTVAMADPDDLLDFNDMNESDFEKPEAANGDSAMSKNFRSKYYKAILPDVLRQLEQYGALE